MNNLNVISWKLVGVALLGAVMSAGCDMPPTDVVDDSTKIPGGDDLAESTSAVQIDNSVMWLPSDSYCSRNSPGFDECDDNCEVGDTCYYSQRDFTCPYRDYDPGSNTWITYKGYRAYVFQCVDIPFIYRNEQGNGCLSTETPEKLRNCDRNTPARRFKLVDGRLRSDAGLCLTADSKTGIVSVIACPKARKWKYDTDRRWFRLQGDGRCLSTRTGAVGDVMRLHDCSTAAARMRWTIKPKD
jgi:hypothetical protein